MNTLRWVALLAVLLGVTGIIQLISSAIDRSVSSSVSAEVEEVVSQLDSRVTVADEAASNSEVAASRAEEAASQASSAAATAQAVLEGVFVASTEAAVSEQAGEWIAANSANASLEDALLDAGRAIRAGYTPAIYFFDDHYLPAIGPFANQEAQISLD